MTAAQSKLWTELYRPQTLDEIIIPERVKKIFRSNSVIQNYLFYGTQGTGKTTLAKILAKQYDTLFINASLKNNVDTIRHEVDSFCSLRSLTKTGIKLVILDEVDYLSNSAQAALRGVIESYSDVARFIFTCNYPDKLLEPIRSRLEELSFDFIDDVEQNEITEGYIKRLLHIANSNGMQINVDAISFIFKRDYPDIRSMIQKLQSLHKQGLTHITLNDVNKVLNLEFEELYKYICDNPHPQKLYAYIAIYKGKEYQIFRELSSFVEWLSTKEQYNSKVGEVAICIHKYSLESKNCIDIFITLLACVYSLSLILNK